MNLTTAQLADRTGVSAGTLRAWRSRYDFPATAPGSSGEHRRYTESDVRAIEEVASLRAEGVSLSAAILRARGALEELPSSIYAGLLQRRPQLRPQVLGKRALLELTRAIEDEHAAHAGTGLLLASFQKAHHYRASESRWQELARHVSVAIAMADFERVRTRRGWPTEIPVPLEDPLAREWTLIVNSPGAHACLASWEIPAAHHVKDSERRFELVWSFDAAVVDDATSVAAAILSRHAPQIAARLPSGLDHRATTAAATRFGSDLAARAVAYLGARL